jgi:hypothetical protein
MNTAMHCVLFTASLLSTSLACQDRPKDPPAPQSYEPDRKTVPLAPWSAEPAPARRGGSQRPAGKPELPARIADVFADPNTVLFDRGSDGWLWACAARYKVGFGAGRAEFIPFLGAEAPRNYPVGFQLAELTVAGRPLALVRNAAPLRRNTTVSFDRGACIEHFALRAEGMEQSFAFHTLEHRGALTLLIDVTTDMPAAETTSDIVFTNAVGQVKYGRAFAIDASGRREEVPRRWTGSGIEITVPAAFVANATLPLVVDPLVGSSTAIHN